MLLAKITQLYGPKHLWITEYGYQTNPPDKTIFGTSWANQAKYMSQAYAIARKNPRIDMMVWFLVRDEPNLGGWQSGLDDRRRQEEAELDDVRRASAGVAPLARYRAASSAR